MDFYTTLEKLCSLPGISGREDVVRDEIQRIASQYSDDIWRDAMGNLIVRKKGRKTPAAPLMIAAHMDEVGFMVNYVTQEGLLRVINVGGVYPQTLAGRTLYFPRSGLRGVLGHCPSHLRKESDEPPKLEDMYVDIGALSEQQALEHIRLGDAAVFDTEFSRMGDNKIAAKALDDRLGCALMLELMSEELPCDVCFAFTVQEELGLRGAKTAAFAVRPGCALILDVAGGADNAGFRGEQRICVQGEGPVISFMDGATIYDEKLFDALCSISRENGIPYQSKTRMSGGTDASSIHTAAAGARVAGISVSGRNIHTAISTVDTRDIDNARKLVKLATEYLADV